MNTKLLLALCLIFFNSTLMAASQCVPVSSWIETKSGKKIDADDLVEKMVDQKIVLLGEDHDNIEHHRWQLSMISQAYAHQQKMAIGFEMLPRSVQPLLDDWVAGELSEAEFLDLVKWNEVWNYNPDYYMPIFHFARMNRIPLYALNIPREFISMIGEKGWDALSEKTREMIGQPAPAVPAYREMMEEVFAQHQAHGSHGGSPHGNGSEKELDEAALAAKAEADKARMENFIQGQLAWDRAMAGVLKKVIERKEIKLVIGVMGAGHIMPEMAVPYQLKSLGENDVLSFMPWDDTMPCDEFSDQMGQYVFGVDKKLKTDQKEKEGVKTAVHKPKRAMLGVFLEKAETGVQIARVVEGSVAEKTGLQKDDIIIEAAGSEMKEVDDVVKVVKGIAPGTWLPLKIKRLKKTMSYVAKFPPK